MKKGKILLAALLCACVLLTACQKSPQPQLEPPEQAQSEPVQTEDPAAEQLERFYTLASLSEEALRQTISETGRDMTGAASGENLTAQFFAAPFPALEDCALESAEVRPERGVMTMRFEARRQAADGYDWQPLCDGTVSLARLGEAGQDEAFTQQGEAASDGAVIFTGMRDGYPVVFRFFCESAEASRLLGSRLSFCSGTAQQSSVFLCDEDSGLRLCVYPETLDDFSMQTDGAVFTCVSSAVRSETTSGFLWSIRRISAAEGAETYPEQAEPLSSCFADEDFVLGRSETDWYILSFTPSGSLPRCMPEDADALTDAFTDSVLALDSFARDNDLEENWATEMYYCAFLRKLWSLTAWGRRYRDGQSLSDGGMTTTVRDANTNLQMEVLSCVAECARYQLYDTDVRWDGKTVFRLYDVVSETMGAGGLEWTIEQQPLADFCAAAGVRAEEWNSWPEDAAGEGCAVLGKTADTVYLLRFASGIQYFPDIPESVCAYADFFRAGKDMLCSFLKLNAITEAPHWQSNYAREQLIRDELT